MISLADTDVKASDGLESANENLTKSIMLRSVQSNMMIGPPSSVTAALKPIVVPKGGGENRTHSKIERATSSQSNSGENSIPSEWLALYIQPKKKKENEDDVEDDSQDSDPSASDKHSVTPILQPETDDHADEDDSDSDYSDTDVFDEGSDGTEPGDPDGGGFDSVDDYGDSSDDSDYSDGFDDSYHTLDPIVVSADPPSPPSDFDPGPLTMDAPDFTYDPGLNFWIDSNGNHYNNISPLPPCNVQDAYSAQRATNFINQPEFTAKLNQVAYAAQTQTNEAGFSMGIYHPGAPIQGYTTSPIATGTANNDSIPTSDNQFFVMGSIHSHPVGTFQVPSATDLYYLLNGNSGNSDFQYAYTVSSNGQQYVLMVTDPQAAQQFNTTYPSATNLNSTSNDFLANSTLYTAYQSVVANLYSGGYSLDDARVAALAYVLSNYNSGITMMEKDADGSFHSVYTVAVSDALGNIQYISYNCN